MLSAVWPWTRAVQEPDQPSAPDLREDAQALALLLRSPRLTVSQVLELLDLGDREFRLLCQQHPHIQHLLELRRRGELKERACEERVCPTCDERYQPYGGARFCSDTCARLASVQTRIPERTIIPRRS